jgi:2-polyprenyl-3-methyl-5-hydroxy-6-metoxy-1,4-benzoquinol methylase
MLRVVVATIVLQSCCAGVCWGQDGRAAFESFSEWKKAPGNAALGWDEALGAYRAKLRSDGLNAEAAERMIRLVIAYDEADLYNRVYAESPKFNTQPNQLLVDAIQDLPPGKALDVGMGQGRNAIYLARKGWRVTGFDVAEVGLMVARDQAAADGIAIEAVHASDEEFDFGQERWELIAIIHAMEKRSVHRVARALKPGGIVVVEAAHVEPGGYPYGYQSNELLKIFEGFRILRYEERLGSHDFVEDRSRRERLVRLIAQKPR